MLNRINSTSGIGQCEIRPTEIPSRYNRNEKDDLKTAIDALYEFKRKLDELHPNCVDLVDNMLQRQRY